MFTVLNTPVGDSGIPQLRHMSMVSAGCQLLDLLLHVSDPQYPSMTAQRLHFLHIGIKLPFDVRLNSFNDIDSLAVLLPINIDCPH